MILRVFFSKVSLASEGQSVSEDAQKLGVNYNRKSCDNEMFPLLDKTYHFYSNVSFTNSKLLNEANN